MIQIILLAQLHLLLEIIFTKDDIFNLCYQAVAFPLLACVTGLPLGFSLVNCLLNISDIILQAMNVLLGMDSYWKEVVGEYMKEGFKGSVSLRFWKK